MEQKASTHPLFTEQEKEPDEVNFVIQEVMNMLKMKVHIHLTSLT